jgi:hypothetical protein
MLVGCRSPPALERSLELDHGGAHVDDLEIQSHIFTLVKTGISIKKRLNLGGYGRKEGFLFCSLQYIS